MTLLPASEFGIRGHLGPAYDVPERCSVPGCGRRSAHAHHLWPRSFLRGQPYEWVKLPDGTVIGNRTGLCVVHHDRVTGEIGGHLARVIFSQGIFWWEALPSRHGDVWQRIGPLYPQPPGVEEKLERRGAEQEDVCPTCHRPRHKVTSPRSARNAKTWTADVPDDGEVGADVLDEFVLWIADALGFDDERSRLRRYHAVVTAMIWVMQRREEFLADLEEAAEA